MRILTLASAVTNTGAQPEVSHANVAERDKATVQVAISATATVSVQGRLGPSFPWVELESVTNSGITVVDAMPEYRADVTANTGQVDAAIAL